MALVAADATSEPDLRRAQRQFLVFTCGEVKLAVELLRVREILQYREPAAVLRVPAHVRGVINLRGSVVPVIDLATRFGIRVRPPGKKACIIIIDADHRNERHTLGVIVDAVHEVLSVQAESIEPVPPFGGPVAAEYLQGLAERSGRYVGLLDAAMFDLTVLADGLQTTSESVMSRQVRN
jgi:purine-binding chemotaxis protein CheW